MIGAFYLNELDRRMESLPVFYLRYMDDVIILAATRWKLRRAVFILNRTLSERGLEKHPAKTFIGPIARGFDYLGYHFGLSGLRISAATLNHFWKRATRLYEQKRGMSPALRGYVARFAGWARAGLVSPAQGDDYKPIRRLVPV